jgi:hypothetical protein
MRRYGLEKKKAEEEAVLFGYSNKFIPLIKRRSLGAARRGCCH